MAYLKGRLGDLFVWNGTVADTGASEVCNTVLLTAQVDDTDMQILSPNHTQVFTSSTGAVVNSTDFNTATATFDKAPGTVTLAGHYIPAINIKKAGQIYGWKLDTSIDILDGTCFQDVFKRKIPNLSDFKGSIDAFWLENIGVGNTNTWLEMAMSKTISGVVTDFWFLKLYTDYTNTVGFKGFVIISGISDNTPVNELVKKSITFEGWQNISYSDSL